MAEHRPFPPSPRRRALAQRAGLHAASPLVTGAVAAGAAVIAATALAGAARDRLGGWIAAACASAGARDAARALGDAARATGGSGAAAGARSAHGSGAAGLDGAGALGGAAGPGGTSGLGAGSAFGAAEDALLAEDVLGAALRLALPMLAAAALAAILAHVAQTRALWLPRRRLAGAPVVDRGAVARVREAGFQLAAGAVMAACAIGWLWWIAPRLAVLPALPLAGGALIASAAAAFAIAWAALGALDAAARHLALADALRMTSHDKREDDRLAGADPRWRAARAKAARGTPREAVAGAAVLVLGDGVAVAIAWDPARRPVPTRTAAGRDARATQLLGLARRHAVAVHRDAALAAALAGGTGPVPERHWARLAEIVAAVRRPGA